MEAKGGGRGTSSGRPAQTYNTRVQSKVRSLASRGGAFHADLRPIAT
jgi:hypothetical protein